MTSAWSFSIVIVIVNYQIQNQKLNLLQNRNNNHPGDSGMRFHVLASYLVEEKGMLSPG